LRHEGGGHAQETQSSEDKVLSQDYLRRFSWICNYRVLIVPDTGFFTVSLYGGLLLAERYLHGDKDFVARSFIS
jgi:hypothetical protein